MPKTFRKEVIKPGTYWPRGEDGKPFRLDVDIDRIRHWSRETNRLMKNGNNVPMPWVHTNEAVPWLEGTPRPGSYDNGAYLTRLRVREDGVLEAELEAGTDEDAEKIGKTVKDVSFFSPSKEWMDGNGKKYKDVFTHLAMVNHPIVTGQENFVPTGGLALSMTMAGEQLVPTNTQQFNPASDGTPKNRLDSVLELLAEHGLELPDDTDEMNFLDHLNVALTAVKSFKEQQEGDADRLENPPEGSRTQQPAPLAMATDQELTFAMNALTAGDNPGTKKPWTLDELKAGAAAEEAAKPQLEFSAEQKAQLAAIQFQAKLPLVERIRQLMAKNVVSPADAESELMPMVKATELQFSQKADSLGHVIEDTPIHIILSKLEKLSPGAALHNQVQDSVSLDGLELSLESGLIVQERPKEWEKGESKEANEKTAGRMASFVS